MRKVILVSDYKGHKIGETIELDNDEASLAINTGFARMSEETAKAEAEAAAAQAKKPPSYTPYNPPGDVVAAKKAGEEAKKKAEEANAKRLDDEAKEAAKKHAEEAAAKKAHK